MANGIDWFRWHHGTVTDQKFPLVAKRSGATVAEVIAVWACLLEKASQAAERGLAGIPDFEALDCALGLQDGKAQRIFEAMIDRDIIDQSGHVIRWFARQPKRERDGDSSSDRVREHRARKAGSDATPCSDLAGGVTEVETPCNATKRPETPREEESREELTPTTPDGVVVASGAADLRPRRPECPHEEIVRLYHEILPMCPQIRTWTPARQRQLRARWTEDPKRQNLDYWRNFFEYVRSCDFLVGKQSVQAGRRPFIADLEWLTKSHNFTKVREQRYE